MRRRGYTAASVRNFIDQVGVAKNENLIEISLLEHMVREDLNRCALRVMGVLNPAAPPVAMTWDGTTAIGRARFGVAHAGPPGCVHGGVLAQVFDQVLNVPNVMTGHAGPTAKLVVHFRKPTPLHADLVFEGWQEHTEGRRVHARGRCLHGDTVTVEAEAVFVRVPVERVMRLLDPS